MFGKSELAFLAVVMVAVSHVGAGTIKEVVRVQAGAANLLKDDAWAQYQQGFTRDGEVFVCDNAEDAKAARGVCQTVTLNQKTPLPIIASASSKAQNVGGGRDSDYSLYLDIVYADGEPLWGQTAQFNVGTHDWERREVRIFPVKPVKQVSFYMLLRGHSGKAMFRQPQLCEVQAPQGAAAFDGVAVILRGGAAEGFSVRDVAGDSDFVGFEDGKALGLKLEVEKAEQGGVRFFKGKLTDTTGKDRAVTLVYTVPVSGQGLRWLANPRQELPAKPPGEYLADVRFSAGANGRLSRYPFGAVANGKEGRAVAIDMGWPAFFRVGFSTGSGELYIAYDIGLTPERSSAEFRFCVWPFDAAWGFRGAVARLYEMFPDYFRCRTPQQGVWMPFHKISKVQGWEDFGFKFKEGNDVTDWDDAHGITTFRYTEPLTWWMRMPKDMPRTMEAALAEAKRLAGKSDRSAQALLTSGCHDENGQFIARLLNTPWCDGAVWSMNSSPAVPGDVTDFKNKWNAEVQEKLYGKARKPPGGGTPAVPGGDLDGEYVDSSEGYVTDVLDFRRDHFATARTALTFCTETHRPAIFKGLIAYEYVRGIADDVHAAGKLMMANGTPSHVCWLAPWLEVMGTETNWNPGGKWRPMSDAELLFRRVMCGPKPFCFLMNTNFEDFPKELVEKYMKRCLAYGMFPGFFSHNASEGHYFSRPELYNRDRPLFRKYVPLCKLVAEAGWRPITGARSSDPQVYVERFGEKYLTVFNDGKEKKEVTITLDGPVPAEGRELVRGVDLRWTRGQVKLPLDAEDVAVIELK